MEIYRHSPLSENLMGSSNYKLGKSLLRVGLNTYDVRVDNKDLGEIKTNFRIFGSEHTIELKGRIERIERPFQIYRKKWELKNVKTGEQKLLINETAISFWIPGVHRFELIEPKTGEVIGELSAQ